MQKLESKEKTLLVEIPKLLRLIADILEKHVSNTEEPLPDIVPSFASLLAKVSRRSGRDREAIAKMVYDNAKLHPQDIADLLKKAGLISPSTYWRDVKVLRDMEQ